MSPFDIFAWENAINITPDSSVTFLLVLLALVLISTTLRRKAAFPILYLVALSLVLLISHWGMNIYAFYLSSPFPVGQCINEVFKDNQSRVDFWEEYKRDDQRRLDEIQPGIAEAKRRSASNLKELLDKQEELKLRITKTSERLESIRNQPKQREILILSSYSGKYIALSDSNSIYPNFSAQDFQKGSRIKFVPCSEEISILGMAQGVVARK